MIYRGMLELGGVPALGDSKKKLGVVTPPAVNPDVVPDANGDVHSPGPNGVQGMSGAPTIQDLPRIRKPVEWGGTETAPSFRVWMIHEDDLAPDLVAWFDSDKHITIGPARKMSLAAYRAALAATRPKWTLVRPPP